MNNTILGSAPAVWSAYLDTNNMNGEESIYSMNNIIYNLPRFDGGSDNSTYYVPINLPGWFITNWHSHNNVYFGGNLKRYGQCEEEGAFCDQNPLFIDTSGNNFHLQSTSPARNAGTTIASVSHDFDGLARPQGSAYDIGAYEFVEGSGTEIRADVDQNSTINSTDAMLTLRNSLGLDMSSTNWVTGTHTGDVNCDDDSNSTDAMLILRKSLGLDMSGTGWCVN